MNISQELKPQYTPSVGSGSRVNLRDSLTLMHQYVDKLFKEQKIAENKSISSEISDIGNKV